MSRGGVPELKPGQYSRWYPNSKAPTRTRWFRALDGTYHIEMIGTLREPRKFFTWKLAGGR